MKYPLPTTLCYILPVPMIQICQSHLGLHPWNISTELQTPSAPRSSKAARAADGSSTSTQHFIIHHTSNVSRNKPPCPVQLLWHVVPWHAMLQCLCVHGPSACYLDHWGKFSLHKTTSWSSEVKRTNRYTHTNNWTKNINQLKSINKALNQYSHTRNIIKTDPSPVLPVHWMKLPAPFASTSQPREEFVIDYSKHREHRESRDKLNMFFALVNAPLRSGMRQFKW